MQLHSNDKAGNRKHMKMHRRIKRRGACLKGGAAKRWAWLVKEIAK